MNDFYITCMYLKYVCEERELIQDCIDIFQDLAEMFCALQANNIILDREVDNGYVWFRIPKNKLDNFCKITGYNKEAILEENEVYEDELSDEEIDD